MALAVLTIAATACGAGRSAEGPATTMAAEGEPATTTSRGDSTAATQFGSEVPFFTHRGDFPDAMGGGELFVDDEGCLRMKEAADDRGATPLWPAGYELDTKGDEIRVVNGKGRVVAKVGDEVVVGGGYVRKAQLEGSGAVDDAEARVLFERCPGPYFLVGEVLETRSSEQR